MYEKLLKVLGQLDDTEFLVTCLEGLGSVVATEVPGVRPEGKSRAGKQSWEDLTRWSVRLCATAEAFRETSGVPLLPTHGPLYERRVTAARARLGEEALPPAGPEDAPESPTNQRPPTNDHRYPTRFLTETHNNSTRLTSPTIGPTAAPA